MHNNTPIVPYISLCSGYEGIGLGLHRCIPNLRCIAYCEREAFAISNLVAKMEKGLLDAAPVFTDVTTFPWEQFAPYMAGGILSFGWPCQPVSIAGKRKATEDERWLFEIIADGISILKPGMLFAENVEGLLSAKMPDGSSVFGHCVERLERLHYKVEAGIFSASEVGAPHQRKRVFILAVSSSLGGAAGLSRSIAWNEGITGVADNGCNQAWPSRPGEPQHAWEPPRTTKTMANSIRSRGEEPEYLNANLPSKSSGCDSEVVANSKHDGFTSCEVGGSTCETIPEQQIGKDNSLNIERAGSIATAESDGMGYTQSRENYGREPRDMDEASSQRGCCDNAANYTSESMGDSECVRFQGWG